MISKPKYFFRELNGRQMNGLVPGPFIEFLDWPYHLFTTLKTCFYLRLALIPAITTTCTSCTTLVLQTSLSPTPWYLALFNPYTSFHCETHENRPYVQSNSHHQANKEFTNSDFLDCRFKFLILKKSPFSWRRGKYGSAGLFSVAQSKVWRNCGELHRRWAESYRRS